MRALLWTGTVIDLTIFLPALYAVAAALATSGMAGEPAWFKVALILTLPVLCIAAPALAWKQFDRSQHGFAILLILVPVALAVILVSLLAFG